MSKAAIKLLSTSIAGLTSKKNELLNHLNKLHKLLRDLEQSDGGEFKNVLKNTTAPQMLLPQLLSHQDKEVKVLVCCCIVDILRIQAPENPYNQEDSVKAFAAIVNQLRGLATYAPVNKIIDSHVFYVLNSIATVQSCVVPVMLTFENTYGAQEVAEQMFSTILSSVRAEHPEQVLAHAVEVLRGCIVESEGKNQELLDQLLLPLLKQNKADNPVAYQVAATVLRNTIDVLHAPLASTLNNILTGSSRESVGCASELADGVYFLLFELHHIVPALLNDVIPNLCMQLHVEEEEVRLRAVMLLSQLFASQYAEYGVEFPRSLKDFLSRANDVSANIRMEVVNACSLIAQYKSILKKHIEEPLVRRLRDPEERIRLAALTRLIDLACAEPLSLAADTYTEMADRAKDRRPEVRRLAMVGLARIYNRNVSSLLPPLSQGTEGSSVTALLEHIDSDVAHRLKAIPGVILQCWGYPEVTSKHLVVYLLQEVLLPKTAAGDSSIDDSTTSSSSSASATAATGEQSEAAHASKPKKLPAAAAGESDRRRASALLVIFEGLNDAERNALAAVMGFKTRVRNELEAYLKARATPVKASRASDTASRSSRSSSSSDAGADEATGGDASKALSAEEHAQLLRKCSLRILQTLPAADKKANYFDMLNAKKDRNVSKLLESCVNPEHAAVVSVQHREDLKQRVVSKSPLGEYVGMVFDFASYLASPAGTVHALVEHLSSLSVSAEAVSCSDLLVMLSKYAPQAFRSSAEGLVGWLNTCVGFEASRARRELKAQLLGQCLSMVGNCSAALEATDSQHELCAALVEHIKKVTDQETCEKLAGLAGQIAYHSSYDPAASGPTAAHAVRSVVALIMHLTAAKTLTLRNKRLDADLAALAALCALPRVAYMSCTFSKPALVAVTDAVRAKRGTISAFVQDVLLSAGDEGKASEGQVSAETAALGLRAMTSALETMMELVQVEAKAASAVAAGKSASSAVSTSMATEKGELKELVTLLFDCIKASGAQLGAFTTEDDQSKQALFEAAAVCALSLAPLEAFTQSLTVDHWHTLGWTMLCPVVSVRQRLFSTLSSLIQVFPLHAKFLAYPCLFATDEVLQLRAEQVLGVAMQRRRRTHEDICSQVIGGSSESQGRLQRLAETLMPEAVLPYLLHLLSYHPDFPSTTAIDNEADKRRMRNLVRIVSMLLHVLQTSLGVESCNMSYLFKMLNTVNRYYIDHHDPDNVGLHFVTRMTVKLLSERIKTSDNLQNHPGEVNLPPELYLRRTTQQDANVAEGSVAVMMLGAGTAEGFEEAELAIDKVLQIAGKSNKLQKVGGAGKTGAGAGAGGGSRKRAVVLSPDRGSDDEHGAPSKRRGSGGTSSAEKEKKETSRLPEEAPTRIVPRRGAKAAAVNYREAAESDKEMMQWEQAAAAAAAAAAQAQGKRPRRSSELSAPRSSSGSAAEARLSFLSQASERKGRDSTGSDAADMGASPSKMRASVSPIAAAARPRSQLSQRSAAVVEEASMDVLEDDEPLVAVQSAAGGASKKVAAVVRASSGSSAQSEGSSAPGEDENTDGGNTDTIDRKKGQGQSKGGKKRTPQEATADTVEVGKKARSAAPAATTITVTKAGKTKPAAASASAKGKDEGKEEAATGPLRRSTRPVRG